MAKRAVANAGINLPVIWFNLGLLLSVTYLFHLEEQLRLFPLLAVGYIGFIAYHFLRSQWQLPYLFLLNLAAIFVLFGVQGGGLLLALALPLYGTLQLPLSANWRILLVLLSGIILALFRTAWQPYLPTSSSTILPVVGSLFMFRTILFLHEERIASPTNDQWLKLNYFFLLPNLIFVVFPVVDYKTFVRGFRTQPAAANYAKAIRYMANGLVHLLLYRLIYYYLVPDPQTISDVWGWWQYVITAYLLITRLAGLFHLSAGLICLFGFDLPPTFEHYFFAHNFNNLWRRINRYWRDFVMKVFYYPVYFRVKQHGLITAIGISILITFVFNWLLHAYQWFWIRGSLLFTIQDVTFWGIFGVAVALNSIWQAKYRPLKWPKTFEARFAWQRSVQILGVFLFMCVLWSWWTSASVQEWVDGLAAWSVLTPNQGLAMIALVAGMIFLGVFWQKGLYWWSEQGYGQYWNAHRQTNLATGTLTLLTLLGSPWVMNTVETKLNIDTLPILTTQMNAADEARQFQGYYESMLDENTTPVTVERSNITPANNWTQLHETGALTFVDHPLRKLLKPNLNLAFKGATLTTNSHGLRDREYTRERPPNTLRLALLGVSIELGSGVNTNETYEQRIEDQLNANRAAGGVQYEILNFGVSGIHLPQQVARMDSLVPSFQPQVVVYTAHSQESERALRNILRLYQNEVQVDPFLDSLFTPLRSKSTGQVRIALRSKMPDIMRWGYQRIVKRSEDIGATPLWLLVPSLENRASPKLDQEMLALAKAVGFHTMDLTGYEQGAAKAALSISPKDNHPNIEGHRRIAERWYQTWQNDSTWLERLFLHYPIE